MSVFTTVARDELVAWLENYSIGSLVTHEGIATGIENTNYFVTTDQGRFVLTLFEKLADRELPFYLNLQDHLARRGVPCPKPVANQTGAFLGKLNGKPAALVSFLRGKDIVAPSTEHCARVGSMLASIHAAGASYTGRMDNPRGPKWWKTVMPELTPFLKTDEVELLREEVRFQARHRGRDLPRGAIHADLFRDNVLFEHGRISGVIDFYFACTDALLYDLAITVNDWCVTEAGAIDDSRAAALLNAYNQGRQFTAEERSAWPVMLRAGALRFWVSRLHDFYLPRPGELTHAKDPTHFRDILERHVAGVNSLSQLVN